MQQILLLSIVSRTSLVVQWLTIHTSSAGDASSIPGEGSKIPCASGQLSPHSETTELPAEMKIPHAATTKTQCRQIKNFLITIII